MRWLFEYYEHFLKFLDRGGPVIIVIIVASVLMWALILERYWYLHMNFPSKLAKAAAAWHARGERSSWYALRIREQFISQVSLSLQRNLPLIKALVTVLPLLGLLGTVSGMITSFEVLRVFGTDNARGVTAGIAEALFTTLTGLLAALSGLYFSVHLHSRARKGRARAAELLALDPPPASR